MNVIPFRTSETFLKDGRRITLAAMTSKSKIIKFIHLVFEEVLLKPQIVLGKDIKMNGVWLWQVKPFQFILLFQENSIFPLKEK